MHDVNLFAVLVAGIVPMVVGERQPALAEAVWP